MSNNDAGVQSAAFPIKQFLQIRGWKHFQTTASGEAVYGQFSRKPDAPRIQVEVSDSGYWALRSWSGQVTGEDVWHTEAEGETLDELRAELLGCGAMEWECPHCGESGGEPRTQYCRYEYGADADGNRGEMREEEIEMCTKCVESERLHVMRLRAEGW
jgi:hypothetical protein